MRTLPACIVLAVAAASCRTTAPAPARPFPGEPDLSSDTFLVLGDSRRGFPVVELGDEPTVQERQEYARALVAEHPAFVVHVGDIARTGADPDQWTRFEHDFGPLRDAGIAVWPTLGNHEYRGSKGTALDNYFARFPWLDGQRWYERTFRRVRLLFLDSNVGELGPELAAEQAAWLTQRLAEAHEDDSVRAVLLFTHHPAWSNRIRPGASEWTRDELVPLAAEWPKARALFVGHVHSYEHFVVDGIHHVVTGGGGSPLHDLADADDPAAHPDLYRGPRSFHWCRVRVGARITVEVVMRRPDGGWSVTDRFVI